MYIKDWVLHSKTVTDQLCLSYNEELTTTVDVKVCLANASRMVLSCGSFHIDGEPASYESVEAALLFLYDLYRACLPGFGIAMLLRGRGDLTFPPMRVLWLLWAGHSQTYFSSFLRTLLDIHLIGTLSFGLPVVRPLLGGCLRILHPLLIASFLYLSSRHALHGLPDKANKVMPP